MADDPLEQYSRLAPRDQALADLEWERSLGAEAGRQARGFGAGVVNPFGVTGWLAEQFGYPSTRDALNRADDEAPIASTMGQSVLPTAGAMTGATLRTISRHPVQSLHLGPGSIFRDTLQMLPSVTAMSGAARGLYETIGRGGQLRRDRQHAREYGAAGYADGGAPGDDPLDQYGANTPRPWERLNPAHVGTTPELEPLLSAPWAPPGVSWGAAMPQSPEEWQHHQDPENALSYMAWLFSPVSAYRGGWRLADAVARGDPWNAALGLGQIGTSMAWPAPGHSMIPAGAPARLMDRTLPPRATPATQAQRDQLYALAPAGTSLTTRPAPLTTATPRSAQQRALDDYGSLPHGPAFPRMEGISPLEARNAFMALRQGNGDFEVAIASLGNARPDSPTVALLRSWQAAGVDGVQALRYFQGLRELRNLERPAHGGHAAGGAVDPLAQVRKPSTAARFGLGARGIARP